MKHRIVVLLPRRIYTCSKLESHRLQLRLVLARVRQLHVERAAVFFVRLPRFVRALKRRVLIGAQLKAVDPKRAVVAVERRARVLRQDVHRPARRVLFPLVDAIHQRVDRVRDRFRAHSFGVEIDVGDVDRLVLVGADDPCRAELFGEQHLVALRVQLQLRLKLVVELVDDDLREFRAVVELVAGRVFSLINRGLQQCRERPLTFGACHFSMCRAAFIEILLVLVRFCCMVS